MKPGCPNKSCISHQKSESISRNGSFVRTSDAKKIQRFICKSCQKSFSFASFNEAFGQKKRRINPMVLKLLSSGVSQRRCALILGVQRLTVKRKFLYLAEKARRYQEELLRSFDQSVIMLSLDDLITIEHTKLKPLSVSIAVNCDGRGILGTVVSQIPAFGHLAEVSRRKYGRRKSELFAGLEKLLSMIKPALSPNAHFETDQHHLYPGLIAKHFPQSTHQSFPSERGAVTGQGELKKVKYDPLFCINHTCAMLRANINRLFRRTWCTTKLPEMLQKHLDIYTYYHNTQLV